MTVEFIAVRADIETGGGFTTCVLSNDRWEHIRLSSPLNDEAAYDIFVETVDQSTRSSAQDMVQNCFLSQGNITIELEHGEQGHHTHHEKITATLQLDNETFEKFRDGLQHVFRRRPESLQLGG